MMIFHRLYHNYIFLTKRTFAVLAFAAVLSTVFAVDSSLCQGIVSAKYFWFIIVLCIISFFIPFQIFKKTEIYIVDVLYLVFVVYISINWFFLNGQTNMHWYLMLLMIPLYIAMRTIAENKQLRQQLLDVVLVIVLIEATWGLMQLYGFTKSYHSLYKVTGTLLNPGPYSCFLAVGIPVALGYVFYNKSTRWKQWLSIATLSVAIPALIASMSRAAWIAAIAGSIPIIWKFHFSKINFPILFLKSVSSVLIHIITMVFIGLLVIALSVGIYVMKKDSADGRWVIWSASMEAIKEHPLFGAGYGRFAAIYGDAQATYFLSDKGNEAQIMVADSPEYAFNEYVQLAVELGIIGLLLFLCLVGSSLFTGNASTLSLRASLCSFLVFAAFSYPFSVLPLSIMFVSLLALSAPESKKINFIVPRWLQIVVIAVCWTVTIYGAYNILPKRTAYRTWTTLQLLSDTNAYGRTAEVYGKFYPLLRHEKKFLFEYGQCLTKAGQYKESNRGLTKKPCFVFLVSSFHPVGFLGIALEL